MVVVESNTSLNFVQNILKIESANFYQPARYQLFNCAKNRECCPCRHLRNL